MRVSTKSACFGMLVVLFSTMIHAEEVLHYLTDNGEYANGTVERNIAAMDTDKNGFADVDEVRAYLKARHGEDYQKDVLDHWLVTAKTHTCGTSATKELTK
jgi:hypothetical protein